MNRPGESRSLFYFNQTGSAIPGAIHVTIGGAIKLTGASRKTLKQHFRALVERGTLDQHGSGRGVWYGLR